MPDADDVIADRYSVGFAQAQNTYSLKGSAALDWGMQNRLARIFSPSDNRTLMLAIDHGYFQGPTAGLERVDLDILPLVEHADAIMLTRGILRSVVPPTVQKGVVLRASGGPSVLNDDLSDEVLAVDADEATRLGVSALAVQVFIGGEHETRTVGNLTRLVDLGNRLGIPVVAVTAVGRNLTRDARYLRLATRICAELGARIVKTYHCDDGFDTVTSTCPVPVVIAGGKKLPELAGLTMAYQAVNEGAAGVDMGRNIFQSAAPGLMIRAVNAVVHGGLKPAEAYNTFLAEKLGPAVE